MTGGEGKCEGKGNGKEVSQTVSKTVSQCSRLFARKSEKTDTPFNDLFIPRPETPMVGWGLGWAGVLVGVGVVVWVGVAGSWAAYPT